MADFPLADSPSADHVRQLVERCLAGDQRAMVALVEQFRGPVFGLCYRMLNHSQDAEDATQETFFRALRNLHRWDPEREFRPWVLAIAGNRCRSMLSARQRRAAPSLLADDPPSPEPAPHRLRDLAEEVRRALDGLRPEYRQAFLLLHEQELSYAEISAALECPVGTIKTWVHRARRELSRELRRRGVVVDPQQDPSGIES